MACHKNVANLVNLITLSLISCSVNVIGVSYVPTKVPDQITPHGERLDISIFNFNHLKEIDHDTFQVIGNPSRVKLTCKSTKNDSEFVNWKYHGLSQDVDLQTMGNEVYLNLTSGPPVARMECILHSNQSISNSSLIYRGDDKAPYLYNHGKSVHITVLNETTARLPCLLKYPLENKTNIKLTLLKDGKEVESDCLNYSHEYGYFLNLTKLEQPFGKYECRVFNSTEDDVVSMVLQLDDITRAEVEVKYNGPFKFFWERESVARVFECIVPKSKFQEKFHWFYLYENDIYEPITPEKSTKQIKSNSSYIDRVKINFPTRNITHVVCAAYLLKDGTSYNNTLAVRIKEPQNPKIVNGPLKAPIIYEEGKNLTCASVGDPIDFHWLKNGKTVNNLSIHIFYGSNPVKKSTLLLSPQYDDKQANYTCVVKNSVTSETVNFTFPVQLPEEPLPYEQNQTLLITIGVVLAAIVMLLLLMITFFKIKFERRRFGDEKIKRFFNGIGGPQQVPYNSHIDEPDSIDSVSYDTSREINFNSLNFVRELKGGNFGKVEFGYYVDTNTGHSMEVAIKSMKDQPRASKEDMDFAFENFLMEIKIMQILDTKHPNVVAYLGAVTSDLSRYSAYLVVEYCHGGDLSSYIKSLKKDGGSFHDDIQGRHYNLLSASGRKNDGTVGSMHGIVLRTSVLMKWCEQVACALDYIASKNLVHRDIAARNVLLAYREHNCDKPDPERLIAKISDFGLSKDLHELPKDYYQIVIYSDPKRNRPRQLPLRWISLEALETLKFSTQSDVWAFGVLMWEMFTLGDIPYREITEDGDVRHKLITHLRNGNTLPEPAYAPVPIWEIMEMCWSELPNRPDFGVIKQMLHAINDNRENNVNIKQEAPLPAIGYSTVYAIQNSPYYPTLDLEDYEDGQSDLNDDDDQHLPVCTCNNDGHSRDCVCNYTSLRLEYV